MGYLGVVGSVSAIVVSLIGISTLNGCQKTDNKIQYALADETISGQSALRMIKKNGGFVRVCFHLMDSNDKELAKAWKASFDVALSAWVGALQGQPGWNVKKGTVGQTILIRNDVCDRSKNDIEFNIWTNPATWAQDVGAADAPSWAHALQGAQTINMGPKFHAEYAFARDWVTVHEFGHLLGLGDLYTIKGLNEPANQPNAMMNDYWPLPTKELQTDDISAIRAAWSYINTNQLTCGPGYRLAQSTANNWSYLFCEPGVPDTGNGAAKICESKAHSITKFAYAVTEDMHLKVFGDQGRMVADLVATKKNNALAKLNGRDVQLMYDARSGTGAGVFIYKLVSDGNIYLKHDGQGDSVPMTCR